MVAGDEHQLGLAGGLGEGLEERQRQRRVPRPAGARAARRRRPAGRPGRPSPTASSSGSRRRASRSRSTSVPAPRCRSEAIRVRTGVILAGPRRRQGYDSLAVTASIAVENPATGETLAEVPELGAAEVATMCGMARAAQPGWEALGFEGRAEVLLAARTWMVANGERVVETICAETGTSGRRDAVRRARVWAVGAGVLGRSGRPPTWPMRRSSRPRPSSAAAAWWFATGRSGWSA